LAGGPARVPRRLEDDPELCPVLPENFEPAVDLIDKAGDDLQPQGFRLPDVNPFWKPDAVILDAEQIAPLRKRPEREFYRPAPFPRKGMFHGVGKQFIGNESGWDRRLKVKIDLLERCLQPDPAGVHLIEVEEVAGQASEIGAKFDLGKVRGLVETLMNESHRSNPVLTLPEHLDGGGVGEMFRLQVEQTGDNLHVILNPVVDLLEKDFLFPEGRLEPVFGLSPLGHIEDRPLDGRLSLVLDPAPKDFNVDKGPVFPDALELIMTEFLFIRLRMMAS